MSTSSWRLGNHTIVLKHLPLLGLATLLIDEKPVYHRGLDGYGFSHRFEVDGIPCAVVARGRYIRFKYELLTGEAAEDVVESIRNPVDGPEIFGPSCLIFCLIVSSFGLLLFCACPLGVLLSGLSQRTERRN